MHTYRYIHMYMNTLRINAGCGLPPPAVGLPCRQDHDADDQQRLASVASSEASAALARCMCRGLGLGFRVSGFGFRGLGFWAFLFLLNPHPLRENIK